jgi:ectoine hydroxylase-related dioxygenase (phytanoyl-CoA dioxygenase family)
MQFVSGSQRRGMIAHVQGPTGWRLDDAEAARCAAVADSVPVAAGTAIVFDANCIHFTAANRSQRRRRATQYHYVSADTAPTKPGACVLEDL